MISSFFIVVVILLLFGFFFWKLTKKNEFLNKNKMLKIVLTLFFSVIIYIISSTIFFSSLISPQNIVFDEDIWVKNKEDRYKMIDDLVESDYFIGKSLKQIETVLGNNKDINKNYVQYELIGKSGLNVKVTTIKLHYKDSIIYKTSYQVEYD